MATGKCQNRRVREGARHVLFMTFFWPLIIVITGVIKGLYDVLAIGSTALVTAMFLWVLIIREADWRVKVGRSFLGLMTSLVLSVWCYHLIGDLNVSLSIFLIILLYIFGFFGTVFVLVP